MIVTSVPASYDCAFGGAATAVKETTKMPDTGSSEDASSTPLVVLKRFVPPRLPNLKPPPKANISDKISYIYP